MEQYNLVPANGWWCLSAWKVTIRLVSHFIADSSASPTGSRPRRGKLPPPPYDLLWSMVLPILPPQLPSRFCLSSLFFQRLLQVRPCPPQVIQRSIFIVATRFLHSYWKCSICNAALFKLIFRQRNGMCDAVCCFIGLYTHL